MNKKEIIKEVQNRYQYLIDTQGYSETDIFGVFLFGSQNYNMQTPTSDIDVKAIIIPSMKDIAMEVPPVSKEINYIDGSHINIIDIRHIGSLWRKGGLNCLEVLFTSYRYINKHYSLFYEKWFNHKNAEMIVKGYRTNVLNSTLKQGLNIFKNRFNKDDNTINWKKVADSYRLMSMAENLFNTNISDEKWFENTLIPKNCEELVQIKELNVCQKGCDLKRQFSCNPFAKTFLSDCEALYRRYENSTFFKYDIDGSQQKAANDIIFNGVSKAIKLKEKIDNE